MKLLREFDEVNFDQMDDVARWLLTILEFGQVVYLTGDLGAGKTTLTSAIAKKLNTEVIPSSPTFSILHEYPLASDSRVNSVNNFQKAIIHLDLYRIEDANELEFIGLREYLNNQHLIFIEWWQNGEGYIPQPDITININKNADNDDLRTVTILCAS